MRRAAFDQLWQAGASIFDHGINQQDHQLQTAARAVMAGASEPTVFAALIHDLAKPLHTVNHGQVAAECFPTLPDEARNILRHHSLAVAWVRGRPHVPSPYRKSLVEFAEWDAASFSHAAADHPLSHYEPLLDQYLER